jgi:exopolyphosphatase/guanosine-5'-triphosphate,3'-diphosphate pyrophosphatase
MEQAPEVLAAVDLGSNSFHMIVGEFRHGQLTIIDRLKETVRLSEGLKDKGTLTDTARKRALACLSRFGERLRDMHASTVRTAGTSALRRASDSGDFRAEAEEALGHPIEVISGIEEARLIYAGVTHSLPPVRGQRLVLDIGGGSTELILGEGSNPKALESLHMGCVLMTERYFPGGKLSAAHFYEARLAARLKLRPIKAFFRDTADLEAVGTSGTIIATESVARELGIIESNDLGLSERRAQVWPGGLAILVELMEVLRVEHLKVSDGALREGLIYDQVGRLQHKDARERSVQAMVTRYNVDRHQADRVSETSTNLLSQLASPLRLQSDLAGSVCRWASQLHEIGLDISHDGFNKHGAYIAANADLPGFPRSEQKLLSFLIASQRADIGQARLNALPENWRDAALNLAIILRLAVLLNRSRGARVPETIVASAHGDNIVLEFPQGWLADNPLTIADLERERRYLHNAGVDLQFS